MQRSSLLPLSCLLFLLLCAGARAGTPTAMSQDRPAVVTATAAALVLMRAVRLVVVRAAAVTEAAGTPGSNPAPGGGTGRLMAGASGNGRGRVNAMRNGIGIGRWSGCGRLQMDCVTRSGKGSGTRTAVTGSGIASPKLS